LIGAAPETPAITDDRPINEYYIVREWMHKDRRTARASLRVK
jgi:hypothetical protein